jgi:deoxyribodipyrimidine photo-lyase
MSKKSEPPIKKAKLVDDQPAGSSTESLVSVFKKDRSDTAESIIKFDFKKKRVRVLSQSSEVKDKSSGIVYWMSRDQRVQDNWAFLYAQKLALKNEVPLHVCFCLVPKFLDATIRQFKFLLTGLEEVAKECEKLSIPFHLLRGEAGHLIPDFVKTNKIGGVVCDFSPLRIPTSWTDSVKKNLPKDVPLCQVDAHNIVPVWVTSDKQEYAARTIRNKVNSQLPTYLTKFPPVVKHPHKSKLAADVRICRNRG